MIFEPPSPSHSGIFSLKTLLQIDNYSCSMSVRVSKCASRSHLFQIYEQNMYKSTKVQRCELLGARDRHYIIENDMACN